MKEVAHRERIPRRHIFSIELTVLECELLVECIDYRFRESDRRNFSGVPAGDKRRTGKFRMLADIRRQLEETK